LWPQVIAAGIFGLQALGDMGGISPVSQILGTLIGIVFAFGLGYALYFATNLLFDIRLSDDEQRRGADLTIHSIGANPEGEV